MLFALRALPVLLVFFLWVWVILDVIATDRIVVRNLPKEMWLMIVIILPAVGSVAWLVLGRPERARFTPGGHTSRPEIRGPEDSADFQDRSDQRRLIAWEEELRRREEELRRREEDGNT